MQGLGSNPPLFWDPEKAVLRQSILILSFLIGVPQECRGYIAISPSFRPLEKVGVR